MAKVFLSVKMVVFQLNNAKENKMNIMPIIPTPFERMKNFLENAGYKLQHCVSEYGSEGYLYFPETSDCYDVAIYFGYPSGKEYYWQLEGKIAVENRACFDKWSKAPFYVWLPESDKKAEKIMKVIEFLKTDQGIICLIILAIYTSYLILKFQKGKK